MNSAWDPVTGEINDSLTGNYVWSRINVGEAINSVMTPFTASFGLNCFRQFDFIPGVSLSGNIGGRIYANRTFEAYITRGFGKLGCDLRAASKELAGEVDATLGEGNPVLAMGKRSLLFKAVPNACRLYVRHIWYSRNIPGFIAGNPKWCRGMNSRIRHIKTGREMEDVWLKEIEPYVIRAFHRVIATAVRYGIIASSVRRRLHTVVKPEEVDILMRVNRNGEFLDSLGPVLGLSRVAKGKMDRDMYLQSWGHRSESEIEAAVPRPFEKTDWLDNQLEVFKLSKIDVDEVLNNKNIENEIAWMNLERRFPRHAKHLKASLDTCAAANSTREAVRSEFIRLIWIVRTWARKTGHLAGIGDDVFFLTVEESLEVLSGRDRCTCYIPSRQATHEKYRSLPAYPSLIRGRFDPFEWAKESAQQQVKQAIEGKPNRCKPQIDANIISGVPGSSGEVTGVVRCLNSTDQCEQLVDGEILVTSVTNIGWTLIFPRVKAVITDIGAVLSHAAVVARELGVPAVVNCEDATKRLQTGDQVRVDGTNGIVEILQRRKSSN